MVSEEPPEPQAQLKPLDAFLLYNGNEALVSIIHARLRDRGLSVWFTQRDLREMGPSVPSGGGDTFDREMEALKAARVAVVFLGAEGWGPNHKQNTAEAIGQRKPMIRVLVSDAPREALNEFGGLFHETPPMQFRNPNDEQALNALVLSIQNGREMPVQEQPVRRPKPAVDAARILKTLIGGDGDGRAETFDELAALSKTHDLSGLVAPLTESLPQFEPQGADDGLRAAARAALLTGLVFAYDENSPKAEVLRGIFERHTDPSGEPDPNVRWYVRVAFFLTGVERYPASLLPDSDPVVQPLVLMRNQPAEFELTVRSCLQLRNSPDARRYLAILALVPVPNLVGDICAALADIADESAFTALTAPAIAEIAVARLQELYGAGKTAEFAARAADSGTPGPYWTRRYSSLLARMDPAEVKAALRRLNASDLLKALEDILGRLRIAGYISDTTARTDELGILTEVQTLCAVMLSTDVEPPLSIGLFGDWGTGKSFFMDCMFEEVKRMKAASSPAGAKPRFHSRVAQIKFNAWHYIDSNLWASLVSHIIEELAKQVKPEEDPATTRKALVSKLETAKEIRDEAEKEKKRAEDARVTAESNLSNVVKERADRQVKLDDLRATDFWKLVQNNSELKAQLEGASKELGLPKAMSGMDDLQAALSDAYSMGGRAKAVALSLLNQPVLIALILLALFCVPAGTWAMAHWLPQQPFFAWAASIVPKLAAAMTVYAAAIKQPLKSVSGALDKLDAARKKAAELIEEKKKEKSAEENQLEKEVNELRAKEASATQQLTAAESRIQEVQAKLDEIDEGRSLAKYLLERFQAEDYRKYLGLVSTVRRDFEKLSSLLRETETEPIQRIILYIDDLDRCAPQRVLEVLQAVHLLLAFELFVVVVGVDPRWLLHSLEKSYSSFRVKTRGSGQEWITTPQNYLEKIFQIPYSLRPMQPAGFGKLMRSLLPSTAHSPAIAQLHSMPTALAPAVSPQPQATPQVAVAEHPETTPQTINWPPQPAPVPVAVQEPAPLEYDALLIQPWEMEFAGQLFEFIPSPRAAKRFTNIYRLLKAPLNAEGLRRFEGIDGMPGDFRAAMILLAVLTGFPESAASVFASVLEHRNTGIAPSEFFGDPVKCGVSRPDSERFRKCFAPLLSKGLPDGLDVFGEWLPRVARFSFGAAKVER